MIDANALLADLKKLVKDLQRGILERLAEDRLAAADLERQHAEAVERGRSGANFVDWRHEHATQAAVAWVLAATFVRFLEDNQLLPTHGLASPDPGGRLAEEAQRQFFATRPHADERHYLRHLFESCAALPAAAALFDRDHNPLWRLDLSPDGGNLLLAAFRRRHPDRDLLVHDFSDPDWNTRFLGDLYQDLSEDIRKRYALLQTPEFVEEFILDHTLEPAIARFGLAQLRLIDPTCGSGHFLLGAFARLLRHHEAHSYGASRIELVQRALDAVHGVDLNPYAVAIARFRLTIAALHACERRFDRAFRTHLATGDSLLHGRDVLERIGRQEELFAEHDRYGHLYDVEDRQALAAILDQTYHVVVGNPPYIVPRDSALNEAYRQRYTTTHRQYSLGVPFTERFFLLAQRGGRDQHPGYVGLITANSFMKREFGTKLVRDFLPSIELTHVIDTSGAYIPGHGTPTVILFGRNQSVAAHLRQDHPVRAILGIRGEPGTPADPTHGLVWREILTLLAAGQGSGQFVSAESKLQTDFHQHPWTIGGGGVGDVLDRIAHKAHPLEKERCDIGFSVITGEDNCMLLPQRLSRRLGLERDMPIVIGEEVRDWSVSAGQVTVWPYGENLSLLNLSEVPALMHYLWPFRRNLQERKVFGQALESKGRKWWEIRELYKQRIPGLTITFAFVATHNHFVLDRGGKVFNRSAPVIKLAAGASEEEHLRLIGLLNSSTACFWIKQVCHNKGSTVDQKGARQTTVPFEDFYELSGTLMQKFPVAAHSPLAHSTCLDQLAQELSQWDPGLIFKREVPTQALIDRAQAQRETLQRLMVFHQEELDWFCYRAYGLLEEDLTWPGEPLPLALGERAFEIAMGRAMAAGSFQTSWFARHNSQPITELPGHWPAAYRELVQRRLALCGSQHDVALIEKPEFKRRWQRGNWDEQVRTALADWLLERLELMPCWGTPSLQSCAQLADQLRGDEAFLQVARLYRGRPDYELATLVEELVRGEAVPALAALRYRDKGLENWQAWCRTWELQRREDALLARAALPADDPQHLGAADLTTALAKEVGTIPVPPKYAKADFREPVYWSLRGKLDVPRERFFALPGCERDGDPSLVVGPAAWAPPARAAALAAFLFELRERFAWPAERLMPVLAALDELVPWLRQWHNQRDPRLGSGLGDYYHAFLDEECRELGLARAALALWRPAAKTRRPRRGTP